MSSVKKIVLEVGGVELSLSPEDAKTLQAALNELYPPKKLKEIQYVPSPYPVYPSRPWHWYEYSSGIRLTSTSGAAINTMNCNATEGKLLNLNSSAFQKLG